jgi:myxalamid-type polyketide synthase MxaB
MAGSDLLLALKESAADERYQVLADHIRHHLAQVLGRASGESIKLRQRLFDLGLDSLMAVELRNRLQRSVGQTLRSTVVFDYPTIEALTDHLAEGVLSEVIGGNGSSDVPADLPRDGNTVDGDSAALDKLSEKEVARLLAEELGESGEGTS